MKQFTVSVPFKEGLHARPASELVRVCQKIKSEIELSKGEARINPKSILGIMSLGAAFGDEVSVTVNGEDEEQAMLELKNYFQA